MKHIKHRWILLISIIIICIYGILTFPHTFYQKHKTILGISIDYAENVMKLSNKALKSYTLENKQEINQLLEIIEKYHYRNYIDKQGNFSEPTSEITIRIWYSDGTDDTIFLYSDGTLSVNYKLSHIGFVGNNQVKDLYQLVYEQYKNKVK